jgi:hypothetical protein
LVQAKAKHAQNPALLRLRKELDARASYETGIQQAEKALAAGENSRAMGMLKWLLKDAPDGRAKDLALRLERSPQRRTRRNR